MASFLYCSPYIYRFYNFCRSFEGNSTKPQRIFLPLRVSKSQIYRYCNSWRSIKYRENKLRKEAKNWHQNYAKKIKSNNFTWSNREKSNIAIAILEKWQLDNTIIIMHFEWTDNIFASCTARLVSSSLQPEFKIPGIEFRKVIHCSPSNG